MSAAVRARPVWSAHQFSGNNADMRGRFAPSPTGDMHLGNARTALLAYLAARKASGQMVLRLEDLDRARISPGAEARLMQDLQWLGLEWDEGPDKGGPRGPYRQSARTALYDQAVAALLATRKAFLCACSRTDVARAASAPHESDDSDDAEGPRYPGTCRDVDGAETVARAARAARTPVVRFRGDGERIRFVDEVWGDIEPLGADGVDDFVLRRADGVAAYQLAVVVDDAAMDITHVLRGADLLRSTPRQLALYRALSLPCPTYAHVPLLLGPAGERLAKRTRPQSIADLRASGVTAGQIIGAMGTSVGLCAAGVALRPLDLLAMFDLARLPRVPSIADDTHMKRT